MSITSSNRNQKKVNSYICLKSVHTIVNDFCRVHFWPAHSNNRHGKCGKEISDHFRQKEILVYAERSGKHYRLYQCILGRRADLCPFQEYAGAGASVPLLGFGNVLMKGVKEAVDESGFIGIFKGGFKAGAVGTSAALVFGYLASLVFNPKMKK